MALYGAIARACGCSLRVDFTADEIHFKPVQRGQQGDRSAALRVRRALRLRRRAGARAARR